MGHVQSGSTGRDRLLSLTTIGMKLVADCPLSDANAHPHPDPCGAQSAHESFDCGFITYDVPFKTFCQSVIVIDYREM